MAQFNEERKDSKEQPVSPRVGFRNGYMPVGNTGLYRVKFERRTEFKWAL